jgi:regulator of extracellular matrix RemA (YlzA/DUF370 family)
MEAGSAVQERVSHTGMTVAGNQVWSLIRVEVTESPTSEPVKRIAMETGEEGRMFCACRRCRYTTAIVHPSSAVITNGVRSFCWLNTCVLHHFDVQADHYEAWWR